MGNKSCESICMTSNISYIDATPYASSLIEGHRDFGYSLKTALADIIDNCIGLWLSGEGWGGVLSTLIIMGFLWDLLSSADKQELNDIADRF